MRTLIMLFTGILLISCGGETADNTLQGYVEGRQLNLAPRSNGILTALNVEEGDQVEAGVPLFAVDAQARAQAQLNEAIAAHSAAESQLMNLAKGGRPEEIRAAQETLNEAQVAFKLADQTYVRSQNLVERGVVPIAKLDQDRATLDASRAKVTEARSRLDITVQ